MPVSTYSICSLDDVLNYMQTPKDKADDDMNKQLESLIDQLSEVFEGYCDRKFLSRSYTEYLDGTGTYYLFPKHYPITSVSGIYDNYSWTWTNSDAISGTNYRIKNDNCIVCNTVWGEYDQNIKIVYTAGYSTIPVDIKLACIEEVVRKWKNKNSVDVLAISASDGSVTRYEKDLMPSTKQTLDRYRKRFTV